MIEEIISSNINKNKTNKKGKKIFIKIFLIIIIFLVLFIVYSINHFYNKKIYINGVVNFNSGDNISKLYNKFSPIDVIFLKLYIKINSLSFSKIQTGEYFFNGSYTKKQIIDIINDGPKINYDNITIIEGWSKYDIDNYLYNKGFINKGDYINEVTNNSSKYFLKYKFLENFIKEGDSLEGFLYPNTYKIDKGKDILDQIIDLQLNSFNKFVREKLENDFLLFNDYLNNNNMKLGLSKYETIILSSIVEMEERKKENIPIVAGILLNKLYFEGMIYADITLCYGLSLTYQDCTPSLINKEIYNKKNYYNTRQNKGLTPTPIGNPSFDTIYGVLNFKKTSNMFYLHDNNGNLHVAETNIQHNFNKSKYLNK